MAAARTSGSVRGEVRTSAGPVGWIVVPVDGGAHGLDAAAGHPVPLARRGAYAGVDQRAVDDDAEPTRAAPAAWRRRRSRAARSTVSEQRECGGVDASGYVGCRVHAASCARSTTFCSTCAAPSACSRRSATPGRRPTSSPPSTTRRAPRGGSPHRHPQASFLQRLRPTARTFRPLLPLYPHAVESLDLRGYDIVVSCSSAWAHGVLVDPGAVHVCYCHNPFRYAWSEREATLAARNPLTRPALRVLLSRWRQWDWIAAQRVDAYVANSAITAARIRRYFGRESTVLHPPVELSRFCARAGRRALPGAGRADGAQAHRRRRSAPSTRSAGRSWSWATGRSTGA